MTKLCNQFSKDGNCFVHVVASACGNLICCINCSVKQCRNRCSGMPSYTHPVCSDCIDSGETPVCNKCYNLRCPVCGSYIATVSLCQGRKACV
jgi:hypothetical protein